MRVTLQYSAFNDMVDQINADRSVGNTLVQKVIPDAQVTIDLPDCFLDSASGDDRDISIAELLFEATNTYEGPLWDRISPRLPGSRTHTALSVKDRVFIDGREWNCDSFGWSRVS